jgi:hypothetical protein
MGLLSLCAVLYFEVKLTSWDSFLGLGLLSLTQPVA